MKIGEMRERVTIQRLSATQDAFGEPIGTPVVVATVWAAVQPQRYSTGVEALTQALGREVTNTTYTVTIYYRSDVAETNQLVWEGQIMDIRRVIDPDGKRAFLEMLCEVTK